MYMSSILIFKTVLTLRTKITINKAVLLKAMSIWPKKEEMVKLFSTKSIKAR